MSILDYRKDVRVAARQALGDRRSRRRSSREVTELAPWPDYLRKDVAADGTLDVFANGRIDYALRGVHARVSVLWNFAAPPGAGDTHHSMMRGTRASLVIRQGKRRRFVPALYLEPHATTAWPRGKRACGGAAGMCRRSSRHRARAQRIAASR